MSNRSIIAGALLLEPLNWGDRLNLLIGRGA